MMRHIALLFVTGGDMLTGAAVALAVTSGDYGQYGGMFAAGVLIAAVSWGFYRAIWDRAP